MKEKLIPYLETRIRECERLIERLKKWSAPSPRAQDRIRGEIIGLKKTLKYVRSSRVKK